MSFPGIDVTIKQHARPKGAKRLPGVGRLSTADSTAAVYLQMSEGVKKLRSGETGSLEMPDDIDEDGGF